MDRDVPLDVAAQSSLGAGRGGGVGLGAGSSSGAPQASAEPREDPDYVASVTAKDFFIQTAPTIVVAGPTAAPVSLGTFQLPAQSVGIIRDLSFGVINPTLTTNIVFHVLDNGARMEGWDTIQFPPQLAAVGFLSYSPQSTFIRFAAGSIIEIQVDVLDGGAYQVYSQAHGWFYPSQYRLWR